MVTNTTRSVPEYDGALNGDNLYSLIYNVETYYKPYLNLTKVNKTLVLEVHMEAKPLHGVKHTPNI